MLPSMPILFTRDSQDAFGNKIEPSTSFYNHNSFEKPVILAEPLPSKLIQEPTKDSEKETKGKTNVKKKDQGIDTKPKIKDNALDTALVRSYYTKVQSRFSLHPTVPTNKFVQFQNILKSFDPSKETPVDLYKKIEQLFGVEHRDIVEEFLLFLKPGQAAEVGRFMDHFMLAHMTTFIELLQKTFARKPTVLRKVLRALTTGMNTGSIEMKNRVLPHLRSNPRLTQMFKALFPDERPPDSVYETGVDILNENFLTNDKGYDVWEFEETTDNKRKLEAKESLDTMYLHGRVFLQQGRMLRSARVSFPYSKEPYRVQARRLAPNHCHLSPPDSDDERASPKRQSRTNPKIPPKKPKKQLKSPTKNPKDVNDNTNKESVTNSPKTVRKQSNTKTKTCNKKDDIKSETQKKDKKDRNDNKNHSMCKKEEGNRIKSTKIDAIHTESRQPVVKGNWTRDEDKIMLQVLKGEAGSEQVFGRISELLPHRSVSEIKERFCHVMNLLQQMAVSEVT